MSLKKVLIDGDIIAYRAAFASEKDFPEDAMKKVDDLIGDILKDTCDFIDPSSYEVYLTGKGNFRFDLAKTAVYKGNRSSRPKPVFLGLCRDYLTLEYGAVVAEGQEADDAIAIRATELGHEAIIASVDKDFLQVPCYHYNITKKTTTKVEEFEGLVFFYKQILTGDVADNIIGLYRVGPAKAAKILSGCESEDKLWEAVLHAYGGDEERVVENARLLWLRREEGELWEPPTRREGLNTATVQV